MLSKYLIDTANCIQDLGQDLGRGSFGFVKKATYVPKKHRNQPEQRIPCAVKYLIRDTFNNESMIKLKKELAPQINLQHPAIIKAFGFSMPVMGEGDFCIVMEYAPNGTLKAILNQTDQGLSPEDWSKTKEAIAMIGIAAGMLYMHQHNIMHRDLKSENVLLDENFYPKIGDFGIAKSNKEGVEAFLHQTLNAGTPAYMAPEIMNGDPYNCKVDVFSYAFVLYEIITYHLPYDTTEKKNAYKLGEYLSGKMPKLDDRFSDFFKGLISECWSINPDERPSFAQILIKFRDAFDNEEIFEDGIYDRSEIEDYLETILKDLQLEDPDDTKFEEL